MVGNRACKSRHRRTTFVEAHAAEHTEHGARPGPVAGEARKLEIATAIGETSRVWFTIVRGRLDEVFYPRPDTPCVRAVQLRVAGLCDDDLDHAYVRPFDRVPLLVAETRGAPYTMTKETIADPRSSAVLQRVRWHSPDHGRVRVDLALELQPVTSGPILHHGRHVLAADLGPYAVALAASAPWASYDGLGGELATDDVTLVLGFGDTPHMAAHVACGALLRGFDAIRAAYVDEWHAWHEHLARRSSRPLWARSACVLKTLEAKHIDGGRVAALAKPWGTHRSAEASGSYHLVWTRDLVETIGGLVAAGAHDEARLALTFLGVTQRPDGHWPQNMELDGTRVWRGHESDETSLPVVLMDLLRREGLLDDGELDRAWPMIVRAAGMLAAKGPSTKLDRWEDTGGLTPFTLATEIAALRIASSLAAARKEHSTAHRFARLAAESDRLVDEQL
jgi:glucoamylase